MIQKLKRLDYSILFILCCLTVVSTMMIYSATINTKYEGLHNNNLMLFAAFCIPLFIMTFFDYRIFVRYLSYALYGLGIALLILVMYKGVDLNGSQRWLSVSGIQFQPSELVKIFVILLLSYYLSKRQGEHLRLIKDIIPASMIVMIPAAFVYKQPDLGTTMVLIGIFIGILWMSNIRLIHMLTFIIIASCMVAAIVWLYYSDTDLLSKVMKPHQIARIQSFLEPAAHPDSAWHVLNSIKAVGTGELWGKGFLEGYFVHNGYIPVIYSDSIFVVIAEEFGFLGSAVLLLLYFILIYRMILIALDSKDIVGSYIVIGVVSMWVVQIFENIGMHIGLLPLTGIALPFISYGGSSLLTNLISLGLVLSVKIHQPQS